MHTVWPFGESMQCECGDLENAMRFAWADGSLVGELPFDEMQGGGLQSLSSMVSLWKWRWGRREGAWKGMLGKYK